MRTSGGRGSLIDEIELTLPALPAALEGLRIAHVSDLHARRPRRRFRRLARDLQNLHVDLTIFTGDYMDDDGDEPAALALMRDLCLATRPRLGRFGVFGNHDSPHLPETFADLPVYWLHDRTIVLDDAPIDVTGFAQDRDRWPDALAAVGAVSRLNGREYPVAEKEPENQRAGEPEIGTDDRLLPISGSQALGLSGSISDRLRLLLCHEPGFLPTAADLGIDVMFAGHTHGGQCRLPGRRTLYNSTDLPLHLSSGVLRSGRTLCVISRGVGETLLPLRTFCRAHVPVYTLRQGEWETQGNGRIECVVKW